MPVKVKKPHPALKHAAYSATSVLPGESAAEFEKLHRDLIAEYAPNGALEDDIVATMTRLVWRKQNLATFRIAELAKRRCDNLMNEKVPRVDLGLLLPEYEYAVDPAAREEGIRAAQEQARNELGGTYELVEIGETATVNRLMADLEVQDRLDAMIDKCLKRLLFVRGLKSISAGSSSAPPRRLAGSSKAA